MPINFAGRTYPTITALHRAWAGEKPSERTLAAKLLRWRKRNPQGELNDDVIRHLFRTRAGTHGLTFRGITYAGPKELYRAFPGEKIGFGGFWFRLNQYKVANPGVEPDDRILAQLLAPDFVTYRGVRYSKLAQLYRAVPGDKIVLHRFVANISSWQKANPPLVITDVVVEECIRFMGGEHHCSFRGRAFRSLKALYDAQAQPKCLWSAFQNRVAKLRALRDLTDEDFALLLQPQAKVAFFKGILYRWTHLRSGKVYIGISAQPLKERVRQHQRQAKEEVHRNPHSLQAAIAADGLRAFRIEVLAEFDDEESMKAAEKRAVDDHDCLAPKGYNLKEGGLGWTKQGTDVEFDGVTYPSYAALASAFGVSEKLLDGRRRWGWSLRDALTTPAFTRNAKSTPVSVRGVEYPSIGRAAKALGVNVRVVYDRLSEGWPIEDAFGLNARTPTNRKTVVVRGVQFPTISAAARHYSVNPRKVYWRMARGETIEKALDL